MSITSDVIIYKKIIKKYTRHDLERNLLKAYLKKCDKTIIKDIILILFSIVFLSLFYYSDNAKEFLFIAYRMVLAHIINPYIFTLDKSINPLCLLENPKYVDIFQENAQSFSSINEILNIHEENLTSLKFEQINLKEKKIIKVNYTSMNSWSLKHDASTLSKILSLYKSNKKRELHLGCELVTNLDYKIFDHVSLLNQIINEKPSNWFAYWRHCGNKQKKSFRKNFRKPNFLPSYAQMTDPSWLVISENFRDRIKLPEIDNVMLIAQIHGSSRLFISRHVHNDVSDKSVILNQGEILTIPSFHDLHEVSMLFRNMNPVDNSTNFNVILILSADINYEF